MLSHVTVDRYLDRLGLARPGAPSVAALRALHRAHVERVPYEALDIHLGRSRSIDPAESAERIVAGRGGYCFQVNGAFAALLSQLGYEVRWHLAGVHTERDPGPRGATGDHLALTVRCEDADWYADVGLGDGFADPLPLRAGVYRQGGQEFRLSPSRVVAGGWRFDHHPGASLLGVDFDHRPAEQAAFHAQHERLWSSPDSPFAQVVAVFRWSPYGCHGLRGLVLTEATAAGPVVRELGSAEDWFGVLEGLFGLQLADLGAAGRAALWERAQAAHRAWRAETGAAAEPEPSPAR